MFNKIIKVNMDCLLNTFSLKEDYKDLIRYILGLFLFKIFITMIGNELALEILKIAYLYLPLLLIPITTLSFIGILIICFFKFRKEKDVTDKEILTFTVKPLINCFSLILCSVELLLAYMI